MTDYETELRKWHEERLNGIGGSEAAIVMGVSPWKSRLELYYEKVERKIPNGNEASNLFFDIGHALEPVIAKHYELQTKRKLEKCIQRKHPEYPFITGNFDRIITSSEFTENGPGILEIKTKGDFVYWPDEQIPLYYQMQLQQYLAVSGFKWGSFAVLDLGTREITCTDFIRDDEMINNIINEEIIFWLAIQNKIPPEVQSTEACEKFLKRRYPKASLETIDLRNSNNAFINAQYLQSDKKKIKEAELDEYNRKSWFMEVMKTAQKAIGNGFVITWKNDQDSTKFDMDSFKITHPKLYQQFLEPKKGVRRFTIKFDKE
jgi:putative phage-type endonuclease